MKLFNQLWLGLVFLFQRADFQLSFLKFPFCSLLSLLVQIKKKNLTFSVDQKLDWVSKMLPIFKTLSCRLCPPIIGSKLVFAPTSPDGSTHKILESMQSADLTCMVTHLMVSSMQLHTILVSWIYLFIYSSASNLVCTCNLRIEHTRSVVFFRLVKFVLYSRSFFSSWCFSSNNWAILAAFSFLFCSIASSFSFSSFSSTSSICSSRSFTILQDLQHLQTKNRVVFQPWTSY